jgi:hypothetical protein
MEASFVDKAPVQCVVIYIKGIEGMAKPVMQMR